MSQRSSKGFTIIELLIATSVFSIILLVLASGLIEIGRLYYKGVISSKTQETARVIAEDIGRSIQFSGGQVSPLVTTGGINSYCVGGRRYSFKLNVQTKDKPAIVHGLLVDNPTSDCVASITGGPGVAQDFTTPLDKSEELLGVNMRLSDLVISQVGTTNLYTVRVYVTYGDDDLLSDKMLPAGLDTCNTGSGSQFCATSILNTIVEKRIQ